MKTTMETEVVQRVNISDVVGEYSNRLSAFIRKRVNRLEDAEDILQEVFFQLSEADRLMKPIDEMTAWLFTVARNRITDLYRKKKPELFPEFGTEADDDFSDIDWNRILLPDENTPETELLRSLVWDELAAALDDMPLEQREVFELTEFEGLSYKEISALNGEPINTLISRKRYAVLIFRDRLQVIYDELLNN
jgi:RNA polymerase sigma factor (sigma-70 family)